MNQTKNTTDYMERPYIVEGIFKDKFITSRHKSLVLAEALARILKDSGKWENVIVYPNPNTR